MKIQNVSRWVVCAAALVVWAIVSEGALAEERGRTSRTAPATHRAVDLFEGMKTGEIEVSFIPKDSRGANVLIRNKTDQPLTIKLPAAFAGVPVLAQFGGGMGGMGGDVGGGLGGGGLGGGGRGTGGGGQGMGGGMGGMGGMGGGGMGGFGGGGFGGFGGGMFNVAAEKVGKFSVTTVCLEHGKDEPSPRMKYVIKPIESFTKDPRVVELCKMVGRGEIPQNTGQAAAWHLANGLTWQELAAKDLVRSRFTPLGTIKYFTPQELNMALQVVSVATARAKNQAVPEETSPGELESPSPGQATGS